MTLLIQIIGCIGLAFRLWLVERKLRNILQYRRYFLSRFISYYFFVAMLYDFQDMAYNLVIIWTLPFMIFATLWWDNLFYKKWAEREVPQWENYRAWLMIERLTLHPPVLICGIIPFFTGLNEFILGRTNPDDFSAQIFSMFFAAFLILGPFMIFDVRWAKRRGWPTGRTLFIFLVLIMLGLFIYVLFISKIDFFNF